MTRLTSKKMKLVGLVVLVLCLAALPTLAAADSFTFGAAGDRKDVHTWGDGRFGQWQWAPITASDPTPDPITSLFVGLDEWNILAAIGESSIAVGEYTGLSEIVAMWVVTGDNALGKPYEDTPSVTEMSAFMTITSIDMESTASMTVKGSLSVVSLANTLGSSVLASLGAAESIDIWFNISESGRSDASLLESINNGSLSAFNLIGGFAQTGGSPTPEVPEPGSMLLLGSGLAALVGWRRRKSAKKF